MQSPFKIFRKHQKTLLVALFLMAMFAFVIGDAVSKWVRVRASGSGSPIVVETSAGNLSQLDINQLIQKRRIVRQFIAVAYRTLHPDSHPQIGFYMVQAFGFGGESREAVLFSWLQRHEARKMGIVVSDDQVEAYIRQFTDRKLGKKRFFAILRNMPVQVTAKELYDMFRDELQAQLAAEAKSPARLISPEKYWEYYQRINTRERIVAAALPVKDFASQVADPSSAQIADFFNRHKDTLETAADGEFKPGFRQPRKVNLQYLTLSYQAVQQQAREAGPITDSEIEEYYEANKNMDRDLYESGPALPDDSTPLDPDISPEPEAPPLPGKEATGEDAADQAKETEDLPPPGAGDAEEQQKRPGPKDAPGEDKPEGGACGTADDGKAAADTADEPKPESADEPENKDAGADEPDGKSDGAAKSAAKSPGKSAKDNGPGKAAPLGQGDKPLFDDEPNPGDADADDPLIAPAPGKSRKKPSRGANIRYKPLDDDLRDAIRDKLLEARTKALIKEKTSQAKEAMVDAGVEFSTAGDLKLTSPTPEQSARLIRLAERALQQIAEKNGMKFDQTGLVSMSELYELPGLGKARESGLSESSMGEAIVAQLAFADNSLCRSFKAESLESRDVYLGWKVEDVAAHVPRLDDPGVREQVVAAWKRLEGVPLAKKRGEELAKRARDSDKSFEDTMAAQTVTGDPRGEAITVTPESGEFSFWRESTAPDPMGQRPRIQLGNPNLEKAGLNFMQAVFDEIGDGEVGVAVNDDASVYYVVKVVSRAPADQEAFKNAPLFSPPYMYLADFDRQKLQGEYQRRLRDKYAVKWHETGDDNGSSSYDEE